MFDILNRNVSRQKNALDLSRLICNLSLESLEEQSYVYFKKLFPNGTKEEIEQLVLGNLVLDGEVENGAIINPTVKKAPDEYTKRFVDNVNFIFRGVFKHTDNKYYRPYAFIKSFGFPDIFCKSRQQNIAMSALNHVEYNNENIGDALIKFLFKDITSNFKLKNYQDFKCITKENRGLHYANKDEDICIVFDNQKFKILNENEKTVAVLFSAIEDSPPSFFKVCETAEEALLYFKGKDGYNLMEYGHSSYSEIYFDAQKNINDINSQYHFLYKIFDKNSKILNASQEILDFHQKESKKDFLEILKVKILAESKINEYGYIDLRSNDGTLFAKVPYLPFAHWALRPLNLRNNLPQYKSQSPLGMKMSFDDPLHTDWMIAGDLDLVSDYDNEVQDVANRLRFKMQNMVKNVDYMVLSNGGKISGKIKFCNTDNAHEVQDGDIVVIPDGSIEYQLHVEKAIKSGKGGVICAIANKVAHLVKVSKERGVTMMQMDLPTLNLMNGMIVSLDPDNGTIKII